MDSDFNAFSGSSYVKMIAMHLFYIPDFVHNFRFHGILWKQKINRRSFTNQFYVFFDVECCCVNKAQVILLYRFKCLS